MIVAQSEGWDGESILQPFVPGRPASASVILGPHQQVASGEQQVMPSLAHASGQCHTGPKRERGMVNYYPALALLAGEQRLSTDGRFHYLGGSLPLPTDLSDRCFRLAWQALNTIPGLRGYVGVDLVLGEAADGSEDWLIEINPRLTTSYVGLRALALTNLADVMIKVVSGTDVPAPLWRSGIVQFTVDDVASTPNFPHLPS